MKKILKFLLCLMLIISVGCDKNKSTEENNPVKVNEPIEEDNPVKVNEPIEEDNPSLSSIIYTEESREYDKVVIEHQYDNPLVTERIHKKVLINGLEFSEVVVDEDRKSYLKISGLKDTAIEEKINNKIKDYFNSIPNIDYSRDKIFGCYAVANFSNILSISCGHIDSGTLDTLEGKKYFENIGGSSPRYTGVGINFNLLTGEELKLEDVVKDTAKITKYLTEEEVNKFKKGEYNFLIDYNGIYLSNARLNLSRSTDNNYKTYFYPVDSSISFQNIGVSNAIIAGSYEENYNNFLFYDKYAKKGIYKNEQKEVDLYDINISNYNYVYSNYEKIEHEDSIKFNDMTFSFRDIVDYYFFYSDNYLVKKKYDCNFSYYSPDVGIVSTTEIGILNKNFLDLIPEEWVKDSVYETKEKFVASLYIFPSLDYSIKDKLELYLIPDAYCLKYNDKTIEFSDDFASKYILSSEEFFEFVK